MDQTAEREIIYSDFIKPDLQNIFNYGKEVFGSFYAEKYILSIINEIERLNTWYLSHPQCRHLETKIQNVPKYNYRFSFGYL